MSRRARGAIPLAALLLTACASMTASPSLITGSQRPDTGIPVANGDGLDVRIEIVDQTGWLLGATAAFSPGFGSQTHLANPPDDSRTLVLQWIGGDCERHRSAVLTDVDGQLRIFLNRGSLQELPDGEACADVARFYEVRFAFDRNVRASSVTLHVTGLGSSGNIRQ